MPKTTVNATSRIELRIRADQKAMIARAAALRNLDLTGFIMGAVIPEAEATIQRSERIVLSERDTLRILDLLENPPEPTEKLLKAAKAENRL